MDRGSVQFCSCCNDGLVRGWNADRIPTSLVGMESQRFRLWNFARAGGVRVPESDLRLHDTVVCSCFLTGRSRGYSYSISDMERAEKGSKSN